MLLVGNIVKLAANILFCLCRVPPVFSQILFFVLFFVTHEKTRGVRPARIPARGFSQKKAMFAVADMPQRAVGRTNLAATMKNNQPALPYAKRRLLPQE